MYKEYKQLNLSQIGKDVLEFWKKNNIFEKSITSRPENNPYTFYEGPPSANGMPGIHHVMARSIKDIFCRYKTLKGYHVKRKGGWDTHGLPIELGVEKSLGITKDDIGKKISIEDYNEACRREVMKYTDVWNDLTEKMGYWVDLEDPYITYKNEYIEYVKISTFNPYTFQPVSVVLAKELVSKYFKAEGENASFEDYKEGDKVIPWIIKARFKGTDLLGLRYHQLMPYVTNADLEKNAFRVIPADFVTTEDGTGIVHTASVFGADDFRACKENGVPSVMVIDETGKEVPLVNKQGRFVDEVTDFAGLYVKEEYYTKEEREAPGFRATDVLISIKLKTENKAFDVKKYEHSYPHSWRTDEPILYYPLDGWFIRTTAVKDKLVALNKTINWKPESTGTGRFGSWLENLVDWNLSRSRFWGTPLPIWREENGPEERCIGSIQELKDAVAVAVASGSLSSEQEEKNKSILQSLNNSSFDLHRPYVDDVGLTSSKGNPMYREADLIDVWFDSGAMPYAQWHFPFEGQAEFKNAYPADFIAEGVDQTRGWFFTLHAIAVMLSETSDEVKAINKQVGNKGISFKNVVSNGLVLDKNGNKMSKRLGNAVDPFSTIEQYGADTARWYMISNASPWDNLKFNMEGLDEVRRKFFGTLYNTYSFFALYANIDKFNYSEAEIELSKRPEIDQWIISLLSTLSKE